MEIKHMNPKDLDEQSKVKINKWLVVGSEEWQQKDDNAAFTRKCIRLGMSEKAPFLFTDKLGRVWGKSLDGGFYPFHFPHGNTNYGLQIPQKAVN